MQTIEQIRAKAQAGSRLDWGRIAEGAAVAANVAYRLLVLYLMARLVVELEALL